jgi:hypothetical protein
LIEILGAHGGEAGSVKSFIKGGYWRRSVNLSASCG